MQVLFDIYRKFIGETYREVTFRNEASDAVVKELELLGYRDNSYQLVVKASDATAYAALVAETSRRGLPAPDFADSDSHILRIRCNNLTPVGIVFLQAIKTVEPTFTEIEAQISEELGTSLSGVHTVPTWLTEGRFSQTFSSGADLNRVVTFRHGASDAVISELKLCGYIDSSYQLIVRARDATSYAALVAEASSRGLPGPEFMDRHSHLLRIRCDNLTPEGIAFLQVIKAVEPTFNEIEEQVNAELGIVIADNVVEYTTGAASAPASNTNSSTATNQDKLEAIEFTEDSLMSDDERATYRSYCCPISLTIMTDPVYATGLAQHSFERSNILEWLNTKITHPITRSPLDRTMLVPNNSLKEEINSFVTMIVDRHRAIETTREIRAKVADDRPSSEDHEPPTSSPRSRC